MTSIPSVQSLIPLQPVIHFEPDILLRAQSIKVAFFDVDGVLTDGGLYFSEHGETLKRFNTLDGHGLKLLQRAGITPAIVTGRDSPALRLRLKALGVAHARFGTEEKVTAAMSILNELNLDWTQAAAIGDDWPDLPLQLRCAFSAAPPEAHGEILNRVHYITQRSGGRGCAREFCDVLLVASGHYRRLLEETCA